MRSVHIRKFSVSYFPVVGLNTLQSEYGKIWTRKYPNTDTFYAVLHLSRRNIYSLLKRKRKWRLINQNVKKSHQKISKKSKNDSTPQRIVKRMGIFLVKVWDRYIFASLLFCMHKREDFRNKDNMFFISLGKLFSFLDNQILTFQILKCHDVIKCLSMKHETHCTE